MHMNVVVIIWKLIINNLEHVENEISIGQYKEDVYMMKYNELLIKAIK